MVRQYEGLKCLGNVRPSLQNIAFCNSTASPSEPRNQIASALQLKKPSSLSTELWDHILKILNPLQAYAVENIMSGKMKENFFLLQGPPGTGKTTTIIGLVSALLNGRFSTNGSKAPGTRVQVSLHPA